MALQQDATFGQFAPLVDAYHLIASVAQNRFQNQVGIAIAVYKDAAARAAYKVAKTDYDAANAELQALEEERLAVTGNTEADNQARIVIQQAQLVAQSTLVTAGAAINANAPVPQLEKQVQIPLADVVDVDGDVTLAACYAWLKTQPDFSSAVDV